MLQTEQALTIYLPAQRAKVVRRLARVHGKAPIDAYDPQRDEISHNCAHAARALDRFDATVYKYEETEISAFEAPWSGGLLVRAGRPCSVKLTGC